MSSPTAACIAPVISSHNGVFIRNLAARCTEYRIGFQVVCELSDLAWLVPRQNRCVEVALRLNRFTNLNAIMPPHGEHVLLESDTDPPRTIRTISSLPGARFKDPGVFRLRDLPDWGADDSDASQHSFHSVTLGYDYFSMLG